jgi:site-specific recombinase XerD
MNTPQTDQVTTLVFAEAPDLHRWADAFLTAKRAEGLSPNTVLNYRKHLREFLRWADLRNVGSVESLTADHVRQFLLTLAEAGHNAGGQMGFYRVLKTFLRWYEKEVEPDGWPRSLHRDSGGELRGWRNPIARVKAPKVPDSPLEPADLGDVERMLRAASDRLAERDRAVLLTLLDTGTRASELTALDLGDLDPITGTLTIRHGKGGKSRSVFLGKRARRAVRLWLKVRRAGDGPLFTAEAGGRLTYSGLRQIVRRLALRAGVPEPPLHSFRRAFALNMLRNGADLLTLQRLMGHADMSLLRRYARQTADDLRAAHALASPVDRAGF